MAALGGKCVYVIDDDRGVLNSTAFLLSAFGYQCLIFAGAEQFLDQAEMLAPGCVLTDFRMPDVDGFQLAKTLRDRGIAWPIFMMTSDGGDELERRAGEHGLAGLLHKPIDADQLDHALAIAFVAIER